MASLSEPHILGLKATGDGNTHAAEKSSRPDDDEREARESEKAWEDHVDSRLRFLPKKDAVLSDIIEQRIEEEHDFHKKVDPRVLERFVACEHKASSQRLNLSCLSLQVVPVKQSLFAQLKVLSLRGNHLTTIPIEVTTALYTVETLNISHNRLSCLPDTLSALVNLTALHASHNSLSGPLAVGPGLFLCPRLALLDLSYNTVTQLHDDVTTCRELHSVLLGHNQLRHLPSSLQHLPLLRNLDISNNPLDLQDLPDRLVLLNEEYALARCKADRRAMVHRSSAMVSKIQDAYKKTLLNSTHSFQL